MMSAEEKKQWDTFRVLERKYKEIFDEGFVIPEPGGFWADIKIQYGIDKDNRDDVEVGIMIMQKCLETGKPFEYPELPEWCVA